MGPYAGVDYNLTSSHCQLSSQPSIPPAKGQGWVGKIYPMVEHICICLLISKTTNWKRESWEWGKG
jgi:hypothetical protein